MAVYDGGAFEVHRGRRSSSCKVEVLVGKAPVLRRDQGRRQGTMGPGMKALHVCSAGIPEGIESVIR